MIQSEISKPRKPSIPFTSNLPFSQQQSKTTVTTATAIAKPVTSFFIPKDSLEDYDIFTESIPSATTTTTTSIATSAPSTVLSTPHNVSTTIEDNRYVVERAVTSPGGRIVKLLSPLQQQDSKKKVELSSNIVLSPSQLDPHFENEITNEAPVPSNKNWITVFGFPNNRLSFVLKHFSTYGEIIEKKLGSGNWVHFLYRDSFAAKKALSKSGKKFDNDLMLGVIECFDPSVIGSTSSKKRKIDENEGIPNGGIKTVTQWTQSETGVKKRALNPNEISSPVSTTSNVYTNFNPNDIINRPQPQRGFWSKLVDMVFKF